MRYYERASSNQNIHTQAHIPFAMTKTFYRMEGKTHAHKHRAGNVNRGFGHAYATNMRLSM